MRPPNRLKQQDVVLLLKLLVERGKPWRQLDLAADLGISQAEITHSLERLLLSGLVSEDKRAPQRLALLEFLIHGLKYVFPAQVGTYTRGVPTAHSMTPL